MRNQDKRRLCNILNSYSGLAITDDPAKAGAYFHNKTTDQIQKGYDCITEKAAITEARRLLLEKIAFYQNEIPKKTAPLIGFIPAIRPLHFAWKLTETLMAFTEAVDSQINNAQDLLMWIEGV